MYSINCLTKKFINLSIFYPGEIKKNLLKIKILYYKYKKIKIKLYSFTNFIHISTNRGSFNR